MSIPEIFRRFIVLLSLRSRLTDVSVAMGRSSSELLITQYEVSPSDHIAVNSLTSLSSLNIEWLVVDLVRRSGELSN